MRAGLSMTLGPNSLMSWYLLLCLSVYCCPTAVKSQNEAHWRRWGKVMRSAGGQVWAGSRTQLAVSLLLAVSNLLHSPCCLGPMHPTFKFGILALKLFEFAWYMFFVGIQPSIPSLFQTIRHIHMYIYSGYIHVVTFIRICIHKYTNIYVYIGGRARLSVCDMTYSYLTGT